MQEKRPFATGSKPGPDAVDQHLESVGYYRKHIARDSSSLFRVISEHMYDIQNHHEKIREKCAQFIEDNQERYEKEINKSFYSYVVTLRKQKTPGTLLELRAMARMYKKNVILFEPTTNLQTTEMKYVQEDEYDSVKPFRVFFSARDGHFDFIYPIDEIERIAECQSIVYGVLYQDVFKLPDVKYCTERMLHDQDGKTTIVSPDDPSKYKNQAGEIVEFDSAESTNCVLKDPRTCHFHNQENFDEVVEEYKNAVTVINRSDDPGKLKIYKPIDGFLHRKDKSCVRQLLDENITPFPYKAAKALDGSIYRNTEFEVWNDSRKLERMKWLENDFNSKYSDHKWFSYDRRRMMNHKDILDQSSYEALDPETKKKFVILNQIQDFNYFIPSRDSVELTVMPANITHHNNFNNGNNIRGGYRRDNRGRGGRGFHQYQRPHYQNQPLMSEAESRENVEQQTQEIQDTQNSYYPSPHQTQQDQNCGAYNEQIQTSQSNAVYNPQHQQWTPISFSAPPPQPFPVQVVQQAVMPYGNFTVPPPIETTMHQETQSTSDVMNLIRDSELRDAKINTNMQESADPNGGDLPLNDTASLRFFYNLGIRYFLATGLQRRLELLAMESRMDTLQVQDTNDKRKEEDSPNVPTNTPVSTKSLTTNNNNNLAPSGYNRPYNNDRRPNRGYGNGFQRQPWSNNTENNRNNNNNNNMKYNSNDKIKFNSNVKNLHKSDHKNVTGISPTKSSPTSNAANAHCQPLSPIPHEFPTMQDCQVVVQPSCYQPYQYVQQPQPNIGFIYHAVNDEMGSYAIQAYTPSPQPYPAYQQAYPMYYPMANVVAPAPHQQQQQQPVQTDTSMISNDSGVAEQQYYQQAPMPYYHQQYQPQPQPVPVYYATAPVHPQTPQITHQAPIFPPPAIVQPSVQETVVTTDGSSADNNNAAVSKVPSA